MTTGSWFEDEVRRQFGALAEELSPLDIDYRVLLDRRDKAVITMVRLRAGGTLRVAKLPDLVVAAGLGRPHEVKTGGQTRRAISQSLASQAAWLRRLVPSLPGLLGSR